MDDLSYSNSAYFSDEENFVGTQDGDEVDEDPFTCTDCSTIVPRDQKGCSIFKKLCATCKSAERDLLVGIVQKMKDPSENEGGLSGDIDDEGTTNTHKEHRNPPDDPPEFADINSAGYLASFWTDASSVQLIVGGEEILFSEKKYHHGPHKSYLDLEVTAIAPLCFNYYVLAAIAMVKDKKVLYSRCWVEHKCKGARYILLCVLRAKCLQVRYDFLLWDKDTHVIYLVCGIKKMEAYRFLPDVTVDHKEAIEVLCAYLKEPSNKLALLPGHPNKDEYGNLLPPDGFDAIAEGMEGLSSKRNRKQRNLQSEEMVSVVVGTAAGRKRRGMAAAKKATTNKRNHKEGSAHYVSVVTIS